MKGPYVVEVVEALGGGIVGGSGRLILFAGGVPVGFSLRVIDILAGFDRLTAVATSAGILGYHPPSLAVRNRSMSQIEAFIISLLIRQ